MDGLQADLDMLKLAWKEFDHKLALLRRAWGAWGPSSSRR